MIQKAKEGEAELWVRFEGHIVRLVSLAYLEVHDEAFQ
jgi:hypothetical protein